MRAVRFAAQLEFAIDPPTERGHPRGARRLPQGLGRARARRAGEDPGRARPSVGLELMRTHGPARRDHPRAARRRRHAPEPLPRARRVAPHAGRRRRHRRSGGDAAVARRASRRSYTTSPSRAPRRPKRIRRRRTRSIATSTSAPPWPTRSAAASSWRTTSARPSSTSSATTCSGTRPSGPTAPCAASSAASASSTSTALFALRAGDVRARGHGEEPGVEIDELKARVAEEIAQGVGAQDHRPRRRWRRRDGGARLPARADHRRGAAARCSSACSTTRRSTSATRLRALDSGR